MKELWNEFEKICKDNIVDMKLYSRKYNNQKRKYDLVPTKIKDIDWDINWGMIVESDDDNLYVFNAVLAWYIQKKCNKLGVKYEIKAACGKLEVWFDEKDKTRMERNTAGA